MGREGTISLRVSSELREALMKMAREEKRSLSRLVETILIFHVKQRKPHDLQEKRRHRRRETVFPALVSLPGTKHLYSAMVIDVSLTGLKLSLPKEFTHEIREDEKTLNLDVHFPLPNEQIPVVMRCSAVRMGETETAKHLGVVFDDCNFSDYFRFIDFAAR